MAVPVTAFHYHPGKPPSLPGLCFSTFCIQSLPHFQLVFPLGGGQRDFEGQGKLPLFLSTTERVCSVSGSGFNTEREIGKGEEVGQARATAQKGEDNSETGF